MRYSFAAIGIGSVRRWEIREEPTLFPPVPTPHSGSYAMADNTESGSRKALVITAGVALAALVALFVFTGENGQPSSPGGPGNPMQTDQGR